VAWSGWLVVTFLAFSFMSGIIHPYYTVALAPAVAALVAIGTVDVWRRRNSRWALPFLAVLVAGSAGWAFVLLGRSSDFLPWLRWVVLVAGVLGTVGLAAAAVVRTPRTAQALRRAGAVTAAVAVLAGPLSYAGQTAATAHTGAIVSAGPSSTGSFAMGGGRGGPGGGAFAGMFTQGRTPGSTFGGQPGTGFPGAGQSPWGTTGRSRSGRAGGLAGGRGGGGGLLGATTPGSALVALLEADASQYRWVAATTGSNNAAGYQLATQDPVMAVGGFNGTDPAPTLAQFQSYVAAGDVHYYVVSRSMASTRTGGSDTAAQIASWVEENFTAQTVDGTTVYDLTQGATASAT
jgi:4-amino-4-deoxy-L-arabinose transferase-like glycosyltransferase